MQAGWTSSPVQQHVCLGQQRTENEALLDEIIFEQMSEKKDYYKQIIQ